MLRKCHKPLQQIVKRLVELLKVKLSNHQIHERNISKPRLIDEHDNGPMLPGFLGRQYKKYKIGDLLITCSSPNSCVFLKNGLIVQVENFVEINSNRYIVGRNFLKKDNI